MGAWDIYRMLLEVVSKQLSFFDSGGIAASLAAHYAGLGENSSYTAKPPTNSCKIPDGQLPTLRSIVWNQLDYQGIRL